ncbi:solute carrier family 35, member F5 [Kwoniella mangroviensis CBS 8886]|nr:solute carrier family 35, member F5 [Kwoniella mangroviensis CBS 8886]
MPGALREANVSRYLVGISLLLGVVLLWTASNFITAGLETGENSYNKPFLITYFNTASFTIYLLPTLWRKYRPSTTNDSHHRRSLTSNGYLPLPRSRSPSHTRSISSSPRTARLSLEAEPEPTLQTGLQDYDLSPISEAIVEVLPRLTIRETAEIAAWWSVVWFVANWAVNASLAWTSVASVTILSSTSGFFTLALGRICGVETFTRTKVFAVISSFIGVLLVTQSDSSLNSSSEPGSLPSHPIFGDFLALLSAAFYAVYVILLKVRVVDEERADMQLMLGFAGLFNTIALIPIFPILHYTGWEKFELPPSKEAVIICLINFCITLSSDYLYVLAMLKTTPMLVTIGLSLTIPLALIGSTFIPSSSLGAITLMSLLGAGLVFVGFGMLGWQGYEETRTVERVVVDRDLVADEAEQ